MPEVPAVPGLAGVTAAIFRAGGALSAALPDYEPRDGQVEMATRVADVFEQGGVLLAEAGTGTGKTLGYLSPATLWARRNDGAAWVSTYTKNLQRQLDQELTRVFPDPLEKREKVAILKGRENYLCLLNYDEAAGGFALAPAREAAFLALVARWIPATRDGDIVGGDFPSWISAEYGGTGQLTDRRGECIYGACRHYPPNISRGARTGHNPHHKVAL